MSKLNLVFDVSRCNSCNNCVLATKDEYLGNHFEGYTGPAPDSGTLWFDLKRHERGGHPMIDVSHYIQTCHQCDNAPCIRNDTSGAVSQRENGVVVIDPDKAKGNKALTETCPYGQIFWNEKTQTAQKWSFDIHLLDSGWKEPRCVQVCPTQALRLIREDESAFADRIVKESLVTLRHDSEEGACVWYKNFSRVTTHFLGGTVIGIKDDEEICIEDVQVTLVREERIIATTATDAFGDFKFDGLAGCGEPYHLYFSGADGSNKSELGINLSGSQYLGDIVLNKL